VLAGRWLNTRKIGGQGPAEPFRIAGNFYYVGATDVAAFLITGPEGHVVIDGGYPTTARLIMASIAKLGFDIKDVEVLLNSEPHPDHGGGLTVLQQASGAQLWASDPSADSLASGGDDPDGVLPLGVLTWVGLVGYPAPRVDHRFKDGDTIRVGPIALTAHMPADIWVTCHARWWGRYRKFVASTTAKNPVDPFIDPKAIARTSTPPKRNYAKGARTKRV
jgi:metallo-beta-lactamase class B